MVYDPPSDGTCRLVLRSALSFAGNNHDLIIEWSFRNGTWDGEALGHTPTLVSSLHEFTVHREPEGLRLRGRIDPDFWVVVHGRVDVLCRLAEDGSLDYEGHFGAVAITGSGHQYFQPAPRPSLGAVDGHPALLDTFIDQGAAGRLYDFSHAGRGTADPSAALPVILASDFGVVADSGREAIPSLQAVVDAAGAMGGAVVQLPAGVLDCNVDAKLPPLHIAHDRVLLRGAGCGGDGTLLVNHRHSETPIPGQPWLAGNHPLIMVGKQQDEAQELAAITAAERGSATIRCDRPEPCAVGDTVLIQHFEDEAGSLAKDLVQHRVAVASNWQGAGTPLITQLARVLAVDGDRVTVDAPLHRSLGPWRCTLSAIAMTSGVGVCDLRIRGHWGGYFIHHKNGEHDNGWDQIAVRRVANGWFAHLVHEHCTTAISMHDCLGCVVQDSRISGNPGHNGYCITRRSTGNLHLRCHAARAMHGFNVQGTICGNAMVDCSMDEGSGLDLHGGIGCDNLLDACTGGINKGGGGGGAVPPRHGPGLTLWNWATGHYDPYKLWQRYDLIADHDTTPGFIAVGCHGSMGQMPQWKGPDGPASHALDEAWGLVVSPGQRVAPRSLWAWQCTQRDQASR